MLAGSRKQEIKDNLPDMIRAAASFPEYQLVLAGAPGIAPEYYKEYVGNADVKIIFNRTYPLLRHAEAALVTSGTATLETGLFRVPQAVCYHTPIGKVIAFLKRHVLKVRYISLVNLIADREVVKELVADTMTVEQIRAELQRILCDEGVPPADARRLRIYGVPPGRGGSACTMQPVKWWLCLRNVLKSRTIFNFLLKGIKPVQ